VPIVVNSLEDRQLLMAHFAAVQDALAGRPNDLASFEGKFVGGVQLETDLRRLRALADHGLIEAPYPEIRR
jgi:hypothetical protein